MILSTVTLHRDSILVYHLLKQEYLIPNDASFHLIIKMSLFPLKLQRITLVGKISNTINESAFIVEYIWQYNNFYNYLDLILRA